jgi:hypothetical protein
MPASRKVCGFTAHNSKHGCNRCTKEFGTHSVGEPVDNSGFETCRSRNPLNHLKNVDDILAQPTQELT